MTIKLKMYGKSDTQEEIERVRQLLQPVSHKTLFCAACLTRLSAQFFESVDALWLFANSKNERTVIAQSRKPSPIKRVVQE